MGRKPTTGRYDTREELEDMVLWYYSKPGHSLSLVARLVRVSASTVAKIIDKAYRRTA